MLKEMSMKEMYCVNGGSIVQIIQVIRMGLEIVGAIYTVKALSGDIQTFYASASGRRGYTENKMLNSQGIYYLDQY